MENHSKEEKLIFPILLVSLIEGEAARHMMDPRENSRLKVRNSKNFQQSFYDS
jgi:hypothetical protein